MSHHRDICCIMICHTPSSIMLTNQKLYFHRNAMMMMIICSLVKITTTHTHVYIRIKNKQIILHSILQYNMSRHYTIFWCS